MGWQDGSSVSKKFPYSVASVFEEVIGSCYDVAPMATYINTVIKTVVFVLAGVSVSLAASIPTLLVPSNGSVVSFVTTTDWNPSDFLTISVSGKVFGLAGNEIGTNAAGILTDDIDPLSPPNVGETSDIVYSYAEGTYLNALMLGTGTDFGNAGEWIQLFRPTVQNGLTSSNPPTTLTSTRMLGAYGGFLASPLPAGTTLYLAVADFFHDDNSGSYTISSVPEPGSGAMFAAALLAVATTACRRRGRG